jgi:hypothetical protein
MRQRMAGLSYSSKGKKFTKQYELLSIEGLRSKVALQKLFQFPGTDYTHSTVKAKLDAPLRFGSYHQFHYFLPIPQLHEIVLL